MSHVPFSANNPPFYVTNSLEREFQDNFVNEADLLNENIDMIRPPESMLHSRFKSKHSNLYDSKITPVSHSRGYYNRQGREAKPITESSIDDIDNHKDWQHYHSYKERRDLYEQLKAITSL